MPRRMRISSRRCARMSASRRKRAKTHCSQPRARTPCRSPGRRARAALAVAVVPHGLPVGLDGALDQVPRARQRAVGGDATGAAALDPAAVRHGPYRAVGPFFFPKQRQRAAASRAERVEVGPDEGLRRRHAAASSFSAAATIMPATSTPSSTISSFQVVSRRCPRGSRRPRSGYPSPSLSPAAAC